MKNNKLNNLIKLSFCMFVLTLIVTSCDDLEIDDAYSRHNYTLEMEASSIEVVLDEERPDDVAFTISWEAAADLGFEYNTSYLFEIEYVGGSAKAAIIEYVAQDERSKSYTHEELQNMLVDYWERPTGATSSLQIRITTNTEGPRVIIPEVATVNVKVKTYGPAPFLANRLFMKGTAVAKDEIEMLPVSGNANMFVYTGDLTVGSIYFPIIYGEDVKVNAVGPRQDKEEVSDLPMDIQVSEITKSGAWQIIEAGQYRVTVNLSTKQISIVPASDVLDLEGLFIAGTAIGAELQMERTLEDDNCYAFRGHLNAGTLYLPILFNGQRLLSIVPSSAGIQAIEDGITTSFGQAETGAAGTASHWEIQTPGTYRIIVHAETKDITIYSPDTDLQPKVVSWNNTVLPQNPYTAPITELWMYGGFNGWTGDGNGFSGFHNDFKMVQSIANPNIFVYKGATLPRTTISDEFTKQSYTGSLRFAVSNIHNNVYAFGSSAPAQRNVSNGYLIVNSNAPQTLVEGQGDNRYAFFCIPSGTNFVVVDVKNLTVTFDTK